MTMTAGFGLEKLGILTARYPRATLFIILATLPIFLFFASSLQFSSDIREIFRSDTEGFAVLENVEKQYPGSGRDMTLVIEGENIFTPEALRGLQNLQLDLALVEDVDYVLSIFSARKPPDAQGNAESVFPGEINEQTDMEALRKEVQEHPLVAGKMLSEDGRKTLVAIALKDKERHVEDLKKVIAEIKSVSQAALEGSGLTFHPTGLATMRVEIIGALIRDQGRFALAGLFLGLTLCWFFFRRWAYVAMAGLPATVAVLWLAGGMSIFGQEVNVLTNIIPVLVVVIVFSDALHLLFGVRHNIADGKPLQEAIELAVHEVGPACVLASATTTIALLSLTLVPHDFIARFGATAALGTAIAYVATITLAPAMCALFLKKTPRIRAAGAGEYWFARKSGELSQAIARMIHDYPYAVAVAGLIITILAGLCYAQNEPRYSYQENLPEGNASFAAIKEIDKDLGGSNLLNLIIQWPKEQPLESEKSLKLIADVHQILKEEPAFLTVTSLDDVQRWMASGSQQGKSTDVFSFLEKAKSPLSTRLFSREYNSALLTAQFRALDSSELIPVLDRLEEKLDKLRKENPGVTMDVTGLVPLSARSSTEMIGKLNRSLAIAIALIILLIGFALRSLHYGIVSIPPNLLPIAMGGTFLYVNNYGLQFTSVVAFTVAFGIAVDSTIHVLNRYRLARERAKNLDDAVSITLASIGPVLIVATIVLIAGVAVTTLSELPMVRLYGQISTVVLFSSLIGAMIFLPALLTVTDKWLTSANLKETPAQTRSGKGRTRRAKAS